MATKSILKNIDVRTKSMGKQLVYAMERAESASHKEKVVEVSVEHIGKDQIEDFCKGLR